MPPVDLSPALREHLAVTYELLRLIGEGGMGVVWLGRDRLLDREVAIKVLRRDPSGDQDTARRFLQEARLAARLQHPGIVPLLTFGEVGEERFYVMPFVRGVTVAERIQRGPMPEADVRRIVAEVADALAYVHARGIVHRDVKPANILLDAESGAAMLTDFGIARLKDATTVTGTGLVVGTPRYLAPEQARAGLDVVDGRADVYALGLVAWEAATGSVPFGEVSPNEMLARKLTGALEDPRTLKPNLSSEFAALVLKAAAMAPEERYSSAATLAAAVRPASVGEADPMQSFDGVLGLAALASIPLSAMFTAGMLSEDAALTLAQRVLIGVSAGVGSAFLMASARLHSLRNEFAATTPWRDLLTRAWRPPNWWFAWWPKKYRHFFLPDHLPPKAARAVRRQLAGTSWILGIGLAVQLPLVLMSFADEAVLEAVNFGALLQTLRPYLIGMPVAVFAALAYSILPTAVLTRRYRRAGINQRQMRRLLGWAYRPEALSNPVLAVLHEFERSEFTPQDLPALREAIDAAHEKARASGWELSDVHSAITRLHELDLRWAEDERALAAEVEAGEAARAKEQAQRLRKLPALSAAQRQMLELLESQLRLVADSEAALAHLRGRRARAVALASALWAQLRDLPAQGKSADADTNIRAISDDLQGLLDESAR